MKSGNKLTRGLWSCLAGATVLVLSQTANSTTFAPELLDGAYLALNALNVGVETTPPVLIEQTLLNQNSNPGMVVGEFIAAGAAVFFGLVLICRVLISRALETLMDS